ncbi:MAG TPA: glycosyltransferase family 2 protein [Candidatus Saccharimonadia bacterium]|nr:glycosyltransferase family 2 protein [Candidatus Saccharimonadia bacterium]
MYVQRRLWWLTPLSMVSFTGITISQVLFGLRHPALFVFLPLTAFTVFYYIISLMVTVGSKDFDYDRHVELVSDWWERVKLGHGMTAPSVDILLPICGEPIQVILNTWRYVKELTYPGVVKVYVLNDGPDGQDEAFLKQEAADLGFVYLRRPARTEANTLNFRGAEKKAGNLHHGLTYSDEHDPGELVVIFDADFVPANMMLMHMVPYFWRYKGRGHDKGLGLLQTPQYFRTWSSHMGWLERGAGAVQEWFYRISQTSRERWDASICVGTCAMYSRKALKENGWTTLIEHSEDVHTGYDLRRLEWQLMYIPVALSTGICPSVRSSFLAQQYRWCMGSMSLLTSRKFWSLKMPIRARAGYLSGFSYYIHTAMLTFVAPAIPLVLLVFYPEMVYAKNYRLITPSLVYTLVAVPLWHRSKFGLSAFAVKMVYGWAHVFALLDKVRGRQKGWQATGNAGSTRGMLDKHFLVGTIGWGCTTALAWIGLAVWRATIAPGVGWVNFMPMLASGLVYAAVVGKTLTKTERSEDPESDDQLVMELSDSDR